MRAADVRQGQMGSDVFVFIGIVVRLEQGPKIRLRKFEVDADNLVDVEDVVPIDLGMRKCTCRKGDEKTSGFGHDAEIVSKGAM